MDYNSVVKLQNLLKTACLGCLGLLLGACGIPPLKPSEGHIRAETVRPGVIPQPVKQAAPLPPPKPTAKLDTYSVVVTNVPAQEILFALARDAKINLDIYPGIQGLVTLNAIDQTLPQILTRIAKQVDMRYVIDGPNLVVEPDKPILRTYKVDYINVSRDVTGNISIATQIATPGSTGGGGGNAATTSIASVSKNDLMKTLIQNVKDILNETDKRILKSESGVASSNQAVASGTGAAGSYTGTPQASGGRGGQTSGVAPGPGASVSGSGNQAVQGQGQVTRQEYDFKEASSVIANPETGILTVRATARQHEKIQEFLDQVMTTAKRQVMIEVTVVEVRLRNEYQQGINWSRLGQGFVGDSGINLIQLPTGATSAGVNANTFLLNFANNTVLGNLTAAVRLLESFGTVKVLSSPRISVLNNQTAMLKVVDNRVYFTIQSSVIPSVVVGGVPTVAVTTTPNTVSVGFVMSVTPQISDADAVTLNIRPTVSRITGFVTDPGPGISAAGFPGAIPVTSRIPEIQTREMESMIRVNSGQTAVMGGLMQDEVNNVNDGIPGLSAIPGVGNLFSQRNELSTKTELVIFLRPIVIKEASIDGDFKGLRRMLPGDDFFITPSPSSPPADVSGSR